MSRTGCTHIYCGDGKGKTTASLGLAIRSAGRGNDVLIVQFLKGQDTGELSTLAGIPNIEVVRDKDCKKFVFQMNEEEKAQVREDCNRILAYGIEKARAGECGLLIFDEICGALSMNVVDEQMLKEFVADLPDPLELVLTGRNPPDWLVDAADYVTEMKKIKHPFDAGKPARRGVEY